MGFVAYAVDEARKSASINDFYVVPEARRRGYGAAMVQEVYAQLDQLGVELVELNVRRDNPPDVFPLLQERYRVRHEQAMLRRVLAPGRYRPVVPKGVSRLGSTDLETVQSLYADGEATGEAPDCFMPAMLEHRVDDGVYEGDWLIAAAGTHGVAPTVSVGALGHVYTRCDRRGRGLASRVTSAVTSHLWDMKSSTVVLNVRENNRAAIRVDEQLGFQTRCHSYEAIAAR